MSAIEGSPPERAMDLRALPRFDLSYLFDTEDDPTEVTVFPATDDFDISTNWITVDVDGAIPLDEIR